jgi:hypothetical protein
MILFLNVFLKPDSAGATWFEYDRGDLPSFSKHKVLLHTLRTYRQVGFSKAYLNIEFHPDYKVPLAFHADCATTIDCPDVVVSGVQVKHQKDWQEAYRLMASEHPGEPIWLAGNHDHPIVDATMIEPIKKLFADHPDYLMSVMYSHWPEFVDQALIHESQLDPSGFVSYLVQDVHSIRVVSQELFRQWWFNVDYGDVELPRSDWWFKGGIHGGEILVKSPWYRSYTPLREVCRHFDGYSHIAPELGPTCPCPPLTIPHRPDPDTQLSKMNCVARRYSREVPPSWTEWIIPERPVCYTV